jgi:hypothetical protein
MVFYFFEFLVFLARSLQSLGTQRTSNKNQANPFSPKFYCRRRDVDEKIYKPKIETKMG